MMRVMINDEIKCHLYAKILFIWQKVHLSDENYFEFGERIICFNEGKVVILQTESAYEIMRNSNMGYLGIFRRT